MLSEAHSPFPSLYRHIAICGTEWFDFERPKAYYSEGELGQLIRRRALQPSYGWGYRSKRFALQAGGPDYEEAKPGFRTTTLIYRPAFQQHSSAWFGKAGLGMTDIAIVGAGPYGLSIAAHLKGLGLDFRLFGKPMQMWSERMPAGMRLKSEGFASCLYDLEGAFPLSRYCNEQGLGYADTGRPVEIETFIGYGRAFQKKFATMQDERMVTNIRHGSADGFQVQLDNGETSAFRRVVMAVGLSYYHHIAPPLDKLPAELASHSSERCDYSEFRGRRVAVVGGGASAADCAIALLEAGASVQILTRKDKLVFPDLPRQRTLVEQIRAPLTVLGTGWKAVLLSNAPLLFHKAPQAFRHRVVRNYLGPAPCWFTRDPIEDQATVLTRASIRGATVQGQKVLLQVDRDGEAVVVEADHVVAATGFKVDLDRLPILSPELRARIRSAEQTPILSSSFESSVPGLYFVGASAANSFGSLVRFACGAKFTADRLSRRLSRNT